VNQREHLERAVHVCKYLLRDIKAFEKETGKEIDMMLDDARAEIAENICI
jgi:hypothetical protein